MMLTSDDRVCPSPGMICIILALLPKPIDQTREDTNLSRGKGTPRRKTKRVHKTSTTDDKKLQTTLKKMNVQPIQAIEEVNMFKEDGNVIHFSNPKGTPPPFVSLSSHSKC
jgi:hypothetical protein